MIEAKNIKLDEPNFGKNFGILRDIFKPENWTDFYQVYNSDIQENIKENIQAINVILDRIAKLTPNQELTFKAEIANLNECLQKIPYFQRGHFERALLEQAKKQKLDLYDPAPKPLVSFTDEGAPLVIHLAGTEVKAEYLGDTLGNLAREQSNYYIQEGVGRYMGSEGRENVENIIKDLKKIYKEPYANNRIILTGFSRGAAAQIYLANRIHEEFNKNTDGTIKNENEWIKIDMFLVDPVYGLLDSGQDAVTREYVIPRCVNTLNIISSNPFAKVEQWFHYFFTRRAAVSLLSDPKCTTIQDITLGGAHNKVGLMDRVLGKRKFSYVLDAFGRLFLDCAQNKTKLTGKELNNLDSHLNKKYIKENTLGPSQKSTVMEYYSSYQERLSQDNISASDHNAIQFSATIPTYLVPAPGQEQYHDLLMKIFGGIIKGDYQTRNYGIYSGGTQYAERTESKLPAHMYEMCQKIENYCNNLKTGTVVKAEQVFKEIQAVADTANKNVSSGRAPKVEQFYSELANKDNKPVEAVEAAVSKLKRS